MKRKGMNALEIVFAMFILIVVTLVVIRLFTTTVSRDTLPKIDDFKSAYNYDKEIAKCENLCMRYTTNYELSDAVSFCQEKVSIDLDGNERTGEKYHGGFIGKLPYCEDGLYCFHISECMNLDARGCFFIMIDYYKNKMGLSEEITNQTICRAITPGTCKREPSKWQKKMYPGFVEIKLSDADCKKYGLEPGCTMPADWWWWNAGYSDIYFNGQKCTDLIGTQTASVLTPLIFSCSGSGKFIDCKWFGCPETGEISIFLNDGKNFYRETNKPIGSFSFGPLQPGNYVASLICGDTIVSSNQIVVTQ